MTIAESRRRKRARRAFRQYKRVAEGAKDDIGFPPHGIVARMTHKWLNSLDLMAF